MAAPQCAMAQPGSALAISSNCRSASSYQKSCSSATPQLNGACTLAAHETENDTVPSRSGAAAVPGWAGWSIAIWANRGREDRASRGSRSIFIAFDYRMSEYALSQLLCKPALEISNLLFAVPPA